MSGEINNPMQGKGKTNSREGKLRKFTTPMIAVDRAVWN